MPLPAPIRIAVFASHYHGNQVLKTLCRQSWAQVVLLATDDPCHAASNSARRIWRYGYDEQLRGLVRETGRGVGLEAYTGWITDPGFIQSFLMAQPDIIIGTVFGQKITDLMLTTVQGRAYNLHPVIADQPLAATKGAKAFERIAMQQGQAFSIVLHRMTNVIDEGEELARSVPFPFPPELVCRERNFIDHEAFLKLMRVSSILPATLVTQHLQRIVRQDLLLPRKSVRLQG